MKLNVGVVALGLVLGYSAIAKTTIDDGIVRDIFGLESRLVEQQNNFLPISPPFEKVYVHRVKTPIAIDFKRFPKKFSSQCFAEMVGASGGLLFPVYSILAYEDSTVWPRETVYLNSFGTEIYRLPIDDESYDPFLWIKTSRQIEDTSLLSDWERWLFDPAKIAAEFVALIPEVFHEDYLLAQEAEAVQELAMAPISMMMSLPAVVTNLVMGIGDTNGMAELELGWPASFNNRLDVFACTDLVAGSWGVVAEKLPTFGISSLVWLDTASSNLSFCAYRAGDADTDSDGDFLPDSHELVIYHSLTNNADSDGGTIPDGYEAAVGMNLNDLADDAAAVAAYQAVAGDVDTDGRPQWLEGVNGTNPHDCFD